MDRDPDHIVLGLLSGQRRAAGLRVEAKCLRPWVRRTEAITHELRPEPPGGAELRHLLEEVVVRVEEEGQPRAEVVHRQPRCDRCFAVGDPVCEGERELLGRRRAGFANVVAGDRDRVPTGEGSGAVAEQVGRQPHRRSRREDVVSARGVLLEDVVLHRAAQLGAWDALAFGDELV